LVTRVPQAISAWGRRPKRGLVARLMPNETLARTKKISCGIFQEKTDRKFWDNRELSFRTVRAAGYGAKEKNGEGFLALGGPKNRWDNFGNTPARLVSNRICIGRKDLLFYHTCQNLTALANLLASGLRCVREGDSFCCARKRHRVIGPILP